MAKSFPEAKLAESVFRNLDFPVIVVTERGEIVAASPGAELLLPSLMSREGGAEFCDLLVEPPQHFADWLEAARFNSEIRVNAGRGETGTPIMVKSAPWAAAPAGRDLWTLSLHQQESLSQQKYEREILLRISSVPIPEMTAEGRPLTADESDSCPITRELLTMIVNYLGGRSGMLFQLEDGHHLSVIGQCGISPREFSGLLSQIEGSELLKVPKEGMLRNAACNGFPYSLNEHDDPEALIETLLELLPFKSRGIWVDGISGFGVVVTFFSESPDHAMRQFATDAYVRLGRHLETSTYHNKLYNAYLKLQNTQEQMVQSSKMAAIGELATGMAHELRQPVTAINNFFTTIFDNLESERYEKLREHLGEYRERSHRNIERLSRIIDHLRTFGRQEPSQIRPTDMNALLDEIFEAFLNAKLAKHNFKIQRECPPNLPMVEIDGPRIEQVILNLISNACDALEGVPDPTITVGLSSDEEILCVEISDNGHGIPEQWIDKLLDPFFTTKAAGKGTGLGLSVSHGIVEGHNGRLLFQNRPEGGASFWIELPLRQP